MASVIYYGGTTAVAQVWKGTITTTTTGHTYTVPLTDEAGNTYTFSYALVGGDTTVTLAALSFLTAWNANTNPLVSAILASQNAGQVILTARTTGVPFYVGSPGGTGTWSGTGNTTANAGPSDYNTAGNFSGGAVPSSGDSLYIDARASGSSILYGLDQSAVTLAALYHYIGAPTIGTVVAQTGTSTGAALKISATIANLNLPATGGVSSTGNLVNLNFGSNATTCTDYGSSYSGTYGLPGTIIAGSHASNSFIKNGGGSAGIGLLTANQSCNFPTISVHGGTLTTGPNTSHNAVTNNGGTVTLGRAGTTSTGGTVTNTAGTLTINGSTVVGTLNNNGGTIKANNRPTVAATQNMNGGNVDYSDVSTVFTVSSLVWKDGLGTLKLFSPSQGTFTATTYSFTTRTSLSAA